MTYMSNISKPAWNFQNQRLFVHKVIHLESEFNYFFSYVDKNSQKITGKEDRNMIMLVNIKLVSRQVAAKQMTMRGNLVITIT